VERPRELLLGALPLLFAVHQLEEGVVWLALEGKVSMTLGAAAVWPYVVYAHALLPVLVPLSILLIETGRVRRSMLWILLALGTGLAGYVLWTFAWYPIDYAIEHHSIVYHDRISGSGSFSTLYVVATSTPQFLARSRWLIAFGGVNIVALLLTAHFKSHAFTSVWCAFAAVISLLILLHFWHATAQRVSQLGRGATIN
jgi:hypothetical protein